MRKVKVKRLHKEFVKTVPEKEQTKGAWRKFKKINK